ncbi:MAG: hypothetical protein ACRCZI_13095 [Cetobacterium sp.]
MTSYKKSPKKYPNKRSSKHSNKRSLKHSNKRSPKQSPIKYSNRRNFVQSRDDSKNTELNQLTINKNDDKNYAKLSDIEKDVIKQSNHNSYYKHIADSHSDYYDNMFKALEIARNFILKGNKTLVGGMAIDFALKNYNHIGIYDRNTLPDYDIISDTYWQDAYYLAVLLKRAGITNISVINALHPSTMRVRVNFKEVADITYVPSHIMKIIPVLYSNGFRVIHPHFQFIDQHVVLAYPYENSPLDNILYRPKKDMVRYDSLYEKYPLRVLHIEKKEINYETHRFPLDLLHNQCITGMVAIAYWSTEAKTLGFLSDIDICDFDILTENDRQYIKYRIPEKTKGLSMFSNNIKDVYTNIKKHYDIETEQFYSQFLDKYLRNCILITKDKQKIQIFDNTKMIASSEVLFKKSDMIVSNFKGEVEDSDPSIPLDYLVLENDYHIIYIANIQHIMMYTLIEYILLDQLNKFRNYANYQCYLYCRELVLWSIQQYYDLKHMDLSNKSIRLGNTLVTLSNKDEILTRLKRFLPTAHYYGNINSSISNTIAKLNFDFKTKKISREEKNKYTQPHHIYDSDLKYGKIPKAYMDFNVKNSLVFDIGGTLTQDFIKHMPDNNQVKRDIEILPLQKEEIMPLQKNQI